MLEKAAAGVASIGGGANTARAAYVQSQDSTAGRACPAPRHGRVVRDTWVKRVRMSAHMLRRPPGWALDVADLDLAEAAGAHFVELREQERGVTYRAPIARIRAKGLPLERGYGKQLALSLGHWVTDGQEPEPERKVEPVQAVLL